MILRDEQGGDEDAISTLITAAFLGTDHSDGSEAAIVERLRADRTLALSLVAEANDGTLIGHLALSPVTISDGMQRWYGLGPIAVTPDRQRQRIGTALIHEAFARMEAAGARGCVVLGDPTYYGRFGFTHDPVLTYPGAPPEFFQRIVFTGDAPAGEVRYAAAFG